MPIFVLKPKSKHPALLGVFFYLLFSSGRYSISTENLERSIYKFEAENSRSAAVVMDPRTAEIVYVHNPEMAFQQRFPPGSIAKVWSAAVFLEHSGELGFNIMEPVFCRGKFLIHEKVSDYDLSIFNLQKDTSTGRYYFKCSVKEGHKKEDLRNGIIDSCNVYFLTKSSQNPYLFYKSLVSMWHLDKKTGAALGGYFEASPLNFSPSGLTSFQASASAIGEGGTIGITPLKVAQIYSAFFSRSPMLVPHFGRKKPVMQFPLKISNSNYELIYSALKETLKTGTLKKLQVDNSQVQVLAGKTGTATHDGKKFATHAWNVIYFKFNGRPLVLVSLVYKGLGAREARMLSQVILNNYQ